MENTFSDPNILVLKKSYRGDYKHHKKSGLLLAGFEPATFGYQDI